MKRILLQITIILTMPLGFDVAQAQTSTSDRSASPAAELRLTDLLAQARASRRARFSIIPASRSVSMNSPAFSIIPLAAGPSLPVTGSGTLGRLTKWAGFTSSNSVIGNSTVFEDKFGMVGIGTDTPTSRLTVMGLIESQGAGGGLKFPDGTIQTTSAAGALFSITHDATLTGNGTGISPLGVAVPLILSGAVPGLVGGIINIANSGESGAGIVTAGGNGDTILGGGVGVFARGGNSGSNNGGRGVFAIGGNSTSGFGGAGAYVVGGNSDNGQGGFGVNAIGGSSSTMFGGIGVNAVGGNSNSDFGGNGVGARGGDSDSMQGGNGVVGDGGNSNSSFGGFGVIAFGGNSGDEAGTGLFARGGTGSSGNGLAGKFMGDVEVTGILSKGGGSFKIDHPLDPENRYLYHSFVESPDMKNIYDGVATLNSNGEAVIELPEWFQALNRDFRYLLTAIGAPMPGLFVAEKIKENRFRVVGGQPGMEVSWQVTGIRRDAFANKNRIKVEEEKPERERGYYLHPEALDQPEELGIQWARNPEMMTKRKEAQQQFSRKQQ